MMKINTAFTQNYSKIHTQLCQNSEVIKDRQYIFRDETTIGVFAIVHEEFV